MESSSEMVPRLGLGVLLALTVNECQQLRPEAVGFQGPKRGKSAKIANGRRGALRRWGSVFLAVLAAAAKTKD
jgi:hypothetical protein